MQRRTRSIEDRHPDFVVDTPSLAKKPPAKSAKIRERLARISGRSTDMPVAASPGANGPGARGVAPPGGAEQRKTAAMSSLAEV